MLTDHKNKKSSKLELFYICNNLMAGCKSDALNPLLADFILLGRRLEEIGFRYSQSRVLVIEDTLQYI